MGVIYTMSAANITLLCVTLIGVALAGECGQFSVGECSLAQENIVDIQDLPCDGIDTDRCVGLCQRICSFTSDCNFFSYNVWTNLPSRTHRTSCTFGFESTSQNSSAVSSRSTLIGFSGPTVTLG